MKTKSALIAALFAASAVIAAGAHAAEGGKAAANDTPAAAQPAPYHSHRDEKVGVPADTARKEAAAVAQDEKTAKKPNPWYDRTKHFHPRDGKQ